MHREGGCVQARTSPYQELSWLATWSWISWYPEPWEINSVVKPMVSGCSSPSWHLGTSCWENNGNVGSAHLCLWSEVSCGFWWKLLRKQPWTQSELSFLYQLALFSLPPLTLWWQARYLVLSEDKRLAFEFCVDYSSECYKESARNAGDLGSIPGSERSPGEENGNPLHYACLENPMDRGPWWATVRGISESDTTEQLIQTDILTTKYCVLFQTLLKG